MHRHVSVIFLAFAASIALAAFDFSNIPPCALKCTMDISPHSACTNPLDFGCSCVNTPFKIQIRDCLQKKCEHAALVTSLKLVESTCSDAGYPLTETDKKAVSDLIGGGKPAEKPATKPATKPVTKPTPQPEQPATPPSQGKVTPAKPPVYSPPHPPATQTPDASGTQATDASANTTSPATQPVDATLPVSDNSTATPPAETAETPASTSSADSVVLRSYLLVAALCLCFINAY